MSDFIEVSGEKTNRGNPKRVKKVCELTGEYFWVDWKCRNQRFKDIETMHKWRTNKSREIVNCLNCGSPFERYKNILHRRSGKPTQYCSNYCNVTSDEKKEKLRSWANSDKNQWNTKECQDKVRQTKEERYGDANYNNMEQHRETMMRKYGVPYSFYLPNVQSNGKTISNGQRELYEVIKQRYSGAKLECFLKDVGVSVDIFIPSENKVIEYFGDYWHCNPAKYDKDYYHIQVHKTAEEIWKYDLDRISMLESNGYSVEVVWESDNLMTNDIYI